MARLTRGDADTGNRLHTGITPTVQGLSIPVISDDLINYLDAVFPDRLNADWDHLEFREAVGARRVVDHLKSLRTEQDNQNVLGLLQGADASPTAAPAR